MRKTCSENFIIGEEKKLVIQLNSKVIQHLFSRFRINVFFILILRGLECFFCNLGCSNLFVYLASGSLNTNQGLLRFFKSNRRVGGEAWLGNYGA